MSSAQDHYAAAAAGFSARVRAVAPDDWVSATPCPDWTARELAVHVVMTHRRVLALLDGDPVADFADHEDLVRAWAAASSAMAAALTDPVSAAATVPTRGGEMPFSDLVDRMICADTLVHTWDLARATGGDEHLDPDLVTHVAGFLSAAGDRIRNPGGFGPALAAPEGASEQDVFIAFTGRRV